MPSQAYLETFGRSKYPRESENRLFRRVEAASQGVRLSEETLRQDGHAEASLKLSTEISSGGDNCLTLFR